jgi:16S rRNA (guanine527-N7)-methyltransferase
VKHVKTAAAALRAQAASLGVELTPQQASKILELESALRDRAAEVGAVTTADLERLRERHILDSLGAAHVVLGSDRVAYDLGSGAGLPGIPVAIARPSLSVTLIERRARKAALLEWLVEGLGLGNARVVAGPIEEVRGAADLCFARALAPLDRAWDLARPLLRRSGRLVFFAGRDAEIPHLVPAAQITVVPRPEALLERAGPLVIMSRE